MAKVSTNAIINAIRLAQQGSDPASPDSGYWVAYIKSTGLFIKDSAGTVTGPFGTSSVTVTTDTIWDAKGDLAAATGSNTASKLAVGSNNQVLTADSTQATGLKWATPSTVATDTIWDTKGDLAVATGADAASKLAAGTNGFVLTADSTQATGLKWAATAAPTESIIVAASDETTALTTGTAKVTFRMPYAFTLTAIRASLTTAQTSGSIFTVDVNEGGSTILSTKITIDNGEKTSTTAVTAPVISDSALADDAEITVDIDQVGDGTAKGLKVTLIGHQ